MTVLLGTVFPLLLTACAAKQFSGNRTIETENTQSETQAVKVGGTLRVAEGQPWNDTFIPYLDASAYTVNLWSLAFDPLLNIDNHLHVIPWLVRRYQWSNNYRTLTCWLQPNANWSDGHPIVSGDVLLAMNFIASPAYNGAQIQGQYGALVANVVGVQRILNGKSTSFIQTGGFQIINNKEFKIHVKRPDAAFLPADFGAIVPLPNHILGKIPYSQWLSMPYDKHPHVVDGAFIPRSIDGQTNVVYQANTLYWKGRPHIGTIDMEYVSPDVMPSLLMQGRLDMALNGLSAKSILRLRLFPHIEETTIPSLGFSYLGMNDKNPIFQDIRVRQAIAYALNRQQMIRGIEKGLAQPINAPIPSVFTWISSHHQTLYSYPYQPQYAKNLLTQAGLIQKGPWRINRLTGKTAILHLDYASGSATGLLRAEAIQQDLQAVGLDVVIDPPINLSTLFSMLEQRDPHVEMWVASWGLGTDPDPRGMWGSHDANNFEQYTSPRLDQLIYNTWALPVDFTEAGRSRQLQMFNQFVNEQLPLVFLWEPSSTWVYTQKLHIPDYDFDAVGEQWPLNPYQWSITS